MTSRSVQVTRALPDELTKYALLNVRDVCAAVRMSASWVHNEVRLGRFPQPLRFGQRCTRWRAADLLLYLTNRVEVAAADVRATEQVTTRAKKASAAAQAKRAAAAIAPTDHS